MKYLKKGRLNWNMFRLLVLCWVLPLSLLTFSMLFFAASKNQGQMEKTILTSSVKAIDNFESKIEMAVTASKNTSYMGIVKESYMSFLRNQDYNSLYSDITLFLNQQYRYNDTIASTMLFFYEQPDHIYYTFSNVAKATYNSSIKEFETKAFDKILDTAKSLKTEIEFVVVDEHLYMVRNIVMPDFTPYGVIVMEMNKDLLFESFNNIIWYEDGIYNVDGDTITYSSSGFEQKKNYQRDKIVYEDGAFYDSKTSFLYLRVPIEGQEYTFGIKLNKAAIHYEQKTIVYVFLLILIFIVPLVFLIINFFFVNITKPIRQLIEASNNIENGQFGIQIEEEQRNKEFAYLVDTFNNMSMKLKNLFGKIFLEEIALRDANIQALQSQINPHFMNNTLEIINWEARMAGNENVTKMIEALSVMLEATMDRSKQRLITLSEELTYVDAYLFIIGKRFGQLFTFEKEVQEDLLQIYVPRLIIQPIIENAVEHGGDQRGRRNVFLKIYEDDDNVYIEVTNNGIMTEEDLYKIKLLLSDGPEEGEKSKNLGISNVNKRLKIIYGDESGLTIIQGDNQLVVSKITINKTNSSQQNAINHNRSN